MRTCTQDGTEYDETLRVYSPNRLMSLKQAHEAAVSWAWAQADKRPIAAIDIRRVA